MLFPKCISIFSLKRLNVTEKTTVKEMAFEALVKIRAKFHEKIGMMLKIKEPPQPDKAGNKS